MEKVIDSIPDEYFMKIQGREHVTYDGLLDAAHKKGLLSIETTLVQAPAEANEWTAISHAVAVFPCPEDSSTYKRFCGIGDANARNTNRAIALHMVRMSETRAKARALRDALNIKGAAWEELGGDVTVDDEPKPQPRAKASQKPDADAPLEGESRKLVGEQLKRVGWNKKHALNWVNKHLHAEDGITRTSTDELTMGEGRALYAHLADLPDAASDDL